MSPTTYRLEQLAVAYVLVLSGALWAVAYRLRRTARLIERGAQAVSPR